MSQHSEIENTKVISCEFTGQPRGGSGGFVLLVQSDLAAAGSSNSDAGQMVGGGLTVVTGADATKGVILPDVEIGSVVWVKNGAAAILKVYPTSGAAINALTATTGAFSQAATTAGWYVRKSATQWYTFPLVLS